jgi:hypothetical protein
MGLLFSLPVLAQGKYAGPVFKKLVNTSFTDERQIAGLELYELQEWVLLCRLEDAERYFLHEFRKVTDRVLLFCQLTDTLLNTFKILDVVEVKNIKPVLEIKTVTCRQFQEGNEEIIALVAPREQEYFTDVRKAWICDKKKKLFRWIPVKGVDCLNEGFEQY